MGAVPDRLFDLSSRRGSCRTLRGNDEIELGDNEYRIKEEMRIVAVAEDVAADVLVVFEHLSSSSA